MLGHEVAVLRRQHSTPERAWADRAVLAALLATVRMRHHNVLGGLIHEYERVA